jgi:hypothetical protein
MNYQTLKEAGYKYVDFNPDTGLHYLRNLYTGTLEMFAAHKNTAGWALIFRNTHLEFMGTVQENN